GGEIDFNMASGHVHYYIGSSDKYTSLYTVTQDPASGGYIGCALLDFENGKTFTGVFSLGGLTSGVFTKGRLIEFDDGTGTGQRGSGLLLQQNIGTATLGKNYAWSVDGEDFGLAHYVASGSFTVTIDDPGCLAPIVTTASISSAFTDANDAGTMSGELTGGSGMFGGSATGCGISGDDGNIGNGVTLTAGTSAAGTPYTYNLAAYAVDSSRIFVVNTDKFAASSYPTSQGVPIVSGQMFATASSFSQSSLSGNYIFQLTGNPSGLDTDTRTTLGIVNLTSGAFTGNIEQYDQTNGFKTSNVPAAAGATYSVGTGSGRVALTIPGEPNAPLFYLVSPAVGGVSAVFVGQGARAESGMAAAGPSGNVNVNSLAGNYFSGTANPGDNTVSDEIDVVKIAASGSITGVSYTSGQGGLKPDSAISGDTLACANTIGGDAAPGACAISSTGNPTQFFPMVTNGTLAFAFKYNTSSPASPVIYVFEPQ
ncbi:MAG TPA: hypothetical protein VEI07_24160, partial [Planctomycetaceae bacterium]|nr:hypothetical protein [Planctomycetaceae bacterium]